MSLGARLALLVFLAAAPIFVYEVYTGLDRRDERRVEAIAEVRRLAILIAANQNRFVESAKFLLTAVAQLDSVQDQRTDGCIGQLEAFRSQLPGLTGLGAIRPDGTNFCASRPGAPTVNIADRQYFREALKSKGLAVSNYVVGRASGAGMLTFALPALDEAKQVRAVVLLTFSSADLSKMLQQYSLPRQAVVNLIDADGVIVARSRDEEFWVGKSVADVPSVRQMLVQETGVFEGAGIDGVDRFYGFAKINQPASLSVAVGMPHEAIFAFADRRFRQDIGFFAAFVLVVAALVYAYAEYGLRRPIRALETTVDRLVRGESPRIEPKATGIKEMVRLSRHVFDMSEALRAREAALQSAVAEKDMLLREVNHRVKNSLQLVSSLFGLHRMEIKDPEARTQFMHAANRVATVAKVHQRLYQGTKVDRVEFGQYLRELCDDLSAALAQGSGQELICKAEECDLPTDQVVPLALIVNELITNAFKYALQNRAGKIEVSWRRTPDGTSRLVIRDYGPGMKDGVAEGKASGLGLGLRMVNALAQQLHAKLEIETSDQGTIFTLAMLAK